MITSTERFTHSIRDILQNTAYEENGNAHSLTCDKLDYYRGLLVATISLIQARYNKDWEFAMWELLRNAPMSSYAIIAQALPLSWRDKWHSLTH